MAGTVAVRGNNSAANYKQPQKVYTLHTSQYSSSTAPPPRPSAPSSPSMPSGPTVPSGGGRMSSINAKTVSVIGQGAAQQVQVPKGIPSIFGNQSVIIMAWMIALAIIFYAEWKEHGILARPKRLWYTSLVYGILCVVGMVEAVVPLATALAVGYTIVLAWQLFNQQGQFEQAAKNSGGGSGGGTGKR